ncbi:MAG: hypothetical protein ACJ8M1_08375 [Chthoniobacterales bacterium]
MLFISEPMDGMPDWTPFTRARSRVANTKTVPSYATLNTSLQRSIKIKGVGTFKVRFDVVNLFDHIYQLRDGSGIGVGAPQFGRRRGFYGTAAYEF